MLDEDTSIPSLGGDPTTIECAAMLKDDTKYIALSDISVRPGRMRSLQQELVDKIAESFEKRGQLQSIVVSSAGSADGSYWLISGWHRLEAARKLGWVSIRALVVEDFDADRAKLAEIDENLIRGELSPAQNLAHHAERKRIYLRMYPGTKAGGDRRSKSHGEILKKPAYIDATAAATGRSRSSIARDVSRSDKIPDVADLQGTSLDKKDELASLAKLPPDQQAELIKRAKAGEKVSAKPPKAVKAARKAKHEKKAEELQAQEVDPATLSTTAQQKLDAAIRQEMRRLGAEFKQLVSAEVAKRNDEIVLPEWRQKLADADKVIRGREGIMKRGLYRKIRACLHPNNFPNDKAREDRAHETFIEFENLKILLCDEEQEPVSQPWHVPGDMAEWDRLREKVKAERRAKREARGAPASTS